MKRRGLYFTSGVDRGCGGVWNDFSGGSVGFCTVVTVEGIAPSSGAFSEAEVVGGWRSGLQRSNSVVATTPRLFSYLQQPLQKLPGLRRGRFPLSSVLSAAPHPLIGSLLSTRCSNITISHIPSMI